MSIKTWSSRVNLIDLDSYWFALGRSVHVPLTWGPTSESICDIFDPSILELCQHSNLQSSNICQLQTGAVLNAASTAKVLINYDSTLAWKASICRSGSKFKLIPDQLMNLAFEGGPGSCGNCQHLKKAERKRCLRSEDVSMLKDFGCESRTHTDTPSVFLTFASLSVFQGLPLTVPNRQLKHAVRSLRQ